MIPVLSVENMRKSDAAAIAGGVPGRELMRRAAQAIFDSVDWKAPVAILCGGGNNGGDGYALAELMRGAGIACTLIPVSRELSEDARYYRERCGSAGVPVLPWEDRPDLSRWPVAVDCLTGTGFRGSLRGAAREAAEAVNASGAYVVSVDINSGLNGDSGMSDCCVRSDLTVSIGSFQPGHFLNMAKDVMKRKINADIGIAPADRPFWLMEAADAAALFPPRKHFSHKGTYGYTALIGGSAKYSGAIRLAAMANAAMRAGAGVVRTAVPDSLRTALTPLILESTLYPLTDRQGNACFREEEIAGLIRGVKTAAFGMGIGVTEETREILRFLLARFSGRLAVDADGLTLLASIPKEEIRARACELVLTPHLGEFSRLTGLSAEEARDAPIAHAEAYARETGAVVLLKGPATVITDGKRTLLTDTGCPGMATAGSGDVLSGVLAALLATAEDPLHAAAGAAWINGRAGELAQARYGDVSMVAGDTAAAIPEVILGLRNAER